jgi:outer membrane protein TolC
VYQLKNSSKEKCWTLSPVLMLVMLSSVALGDDISQRQSAWHAQLEKPPAKLTSAATSVDDLIENVLTNNSQLRAQYADWKVKVAAQKTVITLPDPTFSMGYFIESVETAQGPQNAKLSIGQTFPWISKTRANFDIKQARADQAYEKLENIRLTLIRDLRLLWNEATYLQNSIDIIAQKSGLSKDLEAVLTTQYTSASISHKGYASVQIQSLKWTEKLLTLVDQLYRIRINLGALLELDGPLDLSAIPGSSAFEGVSQSDHGFSNLHPKLLSLDKSIESSEAAQVAALADYYPDLRMGLDYIFTGEKVVDGSAIPESGQDPIIFSMGFSIPIWNWGKQRSAVNVAKYQVEQAQALRNHAEIQLRMQHAIALSELAENQRQIALFTDVLIPKSEEIVQVAEQAYISQSADIEALTETRQELLNLRLRLAKAQYSAEIQNITIAYLEGE